MQAAELDKESGAHHDRTLENRTKLKKPAERLSGSRSNRDSKVEPIPEAGFGSFTAGRSRSRRLQAEGVPESRSTRSRARAYRVNCNPSTPLAIQHRNIRGDGFKQNCIGGTRRHAEASGTANRLGHAVVHECGRMGTCASTQLPDDQAERWRGVGIARSPASRRLLDPEGRTRERGRCVLEQIITGGLAGSVSCTGTLCAAKCPEVAHVSLLICGKSPSLRMKLKGTAFVLWPHGYGCWRTNSSADVGRRDRLDDAVGVQQFGRRRRKFRSSACGPQRSDRQL